MSGLGERWQFGVHGNGRNVFQLRVNVGWQGNAKITQHVLQALHGKGCLGCLVTRACEANNQAVTDQVIGSYASDIGQILDGQRVCIMARHA